jgi:hypothetical protein
MQALQRLLLQALDPHWHDVGTAHRLKQCGRISGVGLVAFHIGAHIGRGQQPYFNAQTLQETRPVMGRAAGFHDHQAHTPIHKPALELLTREPRAFKHLPMAISHRQLEHRLCQIYRDRRSIHT